MATFQRKNFSKISQTSKTINQHDGVVVRASVSQSVDLGFIPLVKSYQKTLKIVFTAFLFGVRHLGDVVESKPASSLVVSLGKALYGTPQPFVKDRWPVNFFYFAIFILRLRESELYRYILDGTSALAWELPFVICLGHLSFT